MMREKTNKIYRSGIVHTDTAEQILDIFRTHLLNHPPRYFGDIDSIAEFLYFQYTETNLVENETVRKSYSYRNKADLFLQFDRAEEASAVLEAIEELFDENNSPQEDREILNSQYGILYQIRGDYKKSRGYFRLRLELWVLFYPTQ